MGLGDYLALLDWKGRQIRRGTRGKIPEHLKPLLDRLEISSSTVGRPKSIESSAASENSRLPSIPQSRQVFA